MDGSQKNALDRIMHDCGVCKKETLHELSGWGEGPFNIRFDAKEAVLTKSYGPQYQCTNCKTKVIPTCQDASREYAQRPKEQR